MSIQEIINIENKILNYCVESLLNKGFSLAVEYDDGEGYVASQDKDKILSCLRQCDEEYIRVWKNDKYLGFILLVYGNDGYDVLADYSYRLKHTLEDVNNYIDSLEN